MDARPESEEEVRRLIRSAGRRPEPPADDLARITTAARTAWREKVGAGGVEEPERAARIDPSLLRSLALAATVLLAVLVGWWWLERRGEPIVGRTVATVELLHGEIRSGGRSLSTGSKVAAGSELSTSTSDGEPARAALALPGGRSLRLASDTGLRLTSPSSMELLHGTIYLDSPPGTGSPGVDIQTALGTVTEVGTQFEVRYDQGAGELDVRVREGAVAVRRADQAATARRGELLAVRRDGSVSRSETPVSGETWAWVLEAAPAFEAEGRPLGAFLSWAGRETGWEIAFEDEALEAAAATIELSGKLDGLRPDQAIDVFLRGSGLDSTLDGDRLIVSRPR